MRLIDADELKATIIEGYREVFFGSVLWNILDDIPTAYDIDKVVEELLEERTEILLSNDYESEIINYCLDNFDRAIEIVEQGVKEQK